MVMLSDINPIIPFIPLSITVGTGAHLCRLDLQCICLALCVPLDNQFEVIDFIRCVSLYFNFDASESSDPKALSIINT